MISEKGGRCTEHYCILEWEEVVVNKGAATGKFERAQREFTDGEQGCPLHF